MIRATTIYFLYVGAAGLLLPGVPPRNRFRAAAAAALGLALTALTASASTFWLRDAVLPLVLLLWAYWASGLLWVAPMLAAERFLARADGVLRMRQIAARIPLPLYACLELAYLGVYPLIPIGFGLHMVHADVPDPERFWTVVLVTDFVCFGMLPWIQTRPPRALEPPMRRAPSLRAFNLGLLRQTSIGVNTVPSGHAAEAVAVALLLSGAPPAVTIAVWFGALAISAGAVLGRYHFALDVLAGWAVALVVWIAFS